MLPVQPAVMMVASHEFYSSHPFRYFPSLVACLLFFFKFFSQQEGLYNRPGLLDDYQHDNNVNKTRNHPVILTQRVRHLGSRMCAKGYFDAKVTRYSNSASTFNIPRLVQCGDFEINPGPEQSSTTTRTKPIYKWSMYEVCLFQSERDPL